LRSWEALPGVIRPHALKKTWRNKRDVRKTIAKLKL